MKAKSSLVVLALSIVSLSCSKPILFSGSELPEDQRAVFAAGPGIDVHHIDGAEVDGRSFIMAPGSYSIEFTSTRDMKQVNPLFKRIMDIYDCKTDIQLESGEELVLTSRLKNDRGSVYMDSFDHVVRFKSSNDEHVRELETASCRHSVNCDRADRLQVLPTNCD